jgi:hypothetical protein
VYIRRCRHRRRQRHRSCTPKRAPLPPIVIPIAVQAPATQPAYQVTEYVQDIYFPAQVYSVQVPVVSQ